MIKSLKTILFITIVVIVASCSTMEKVGLSDRKAPVPGNIRSPIGNTDILLNSSNRGNVSGVRTKYQDASYKGIYDRYRAEQKAQQQDEAVVVIDVPNASEVEKKKDSAGSSKPVNLLDRRVPTEQPVVKHESKLPMPSVIEDIPLMAKDEERTSINMEEFEEIINPEEYQEESSAVEEKIDEAPKKAELSPVDDKVVEVSEPVDNSNPSSAGEMLPENVNIAPIMEEEASTMKSVPEDVTPSTVEGPVGRTEETMSAKDMLLEFQKENEKQKIIEPPLEPVVVEPKIIEEKPEKGLQDKISDWFNSWFGSEEQQEEAPVKQDNKSMKKEEDPELLSIPELQIKNSISSIQGDSYLGRLVDNVMIRFRTSL
jgi:hypothetical protein